MTAPSKPVVIALAGVAGLVVVVMGVLWLRSRASPPETILTPSSALSEIPSPGVTTTMSISDQASSTTSSLSETDLPDGKGREIPHDADGDGLSDDEEVRAGTNLLLRDTDGDGITDYEEVRVLHTDPLFFDHQKTAVIPMIVEPTTATTSSLPRLDSDHDGLTDQDEVKYQTNPLNPDTDSDSYPDGAEVQKGYNPRGPGTCATPSCLP